MNATAVIAAIDALHQQDPTGKELGYAERMTHWLHQLDDRPDVLLGIAVRAQHLKRWECPRDAYPTGRRGYLAWREAAARHHAALTESIMREAGCATAAVERVSDLIKKHGLGTSRDAQTLEDCACLVFIEGDLVGFKAKHDAAMVDRILKRTFKKMSPAAQGLATALLAGD